MMMKPGQIKTNAKVILARVTNTSEIALLHLFIFITTCIDYKQLDKLKTTYYGDYYDFYRDTMLWYNYYISSYQATCMHVQMYNVKKYIYS